MKNFEWLPAWSVFYAMVCKEQVLGNFNYLSCLRPIDTAFEHSFHKSKKIAYEIVGY